MKNKYSKGCCKRRPAFAIIISTQQTNNPEHDMTNPIKAAEAAEAIAEALYANDYRKHSGEWYKQIDSEGCGLTSAEQEINARGGLNFGTDAAQILRDRVADERDYIEQFSAEEISDDSKFEWLADWIGSATRSLKLHDKAG